MPEMFWVRKGKSMSGNLEKGDKVNEIKTKYNEYEIIFHDYNELWNLKTCDCPSIYSNKSFQAVKEYADRLIKKNFKHFEAWLTSFRYPQSIKITVTSITPDGFYWVKYPGGNRGKEPAHNVFADNESNRENIKQIESLRKQINDIKTTIENIKMKLILHKIPSEEKENE